MRAFIIDWIALWVGGNTAAVLIFGSIDRASVVVSIVTAAILVGVFRAVGFAWSEHVAWRIGVVLRGWARGGGE